MTDSSKNNLSDYNDDDDDEKGECCAGANPLVSSNLATTVLVLNCIVPGVGSLVASYADLNGCNCKCATYGIFQMLTAIFIVGYICSIFQGLAIYRKSRAAENNGTLPTP